MPHSRVLALLLATVTLLAAPFVRADIGIQPIPDQDIPSGKTLVVPIPATDPGGPARSYTVTVGAATTGTAAVSATAAGIVATIRTGDPHFILGVAYTDTNNVMQTGTMEFQFLREFSPIATQIIGGLTEGGFYSPTMTDGTTNYLTFFRIVPGFVIQAGSPTNVNTGGPGFTFENEYSKALIFSATAGQLAMANGGTNAQGDSNGSQFFITVSNSQREALDFTYTIFGQLLRGYDTLTGISNVGLPPGGSDPINPVNITSATVTQNDTDAVLLLSATGVCDAPVTVTVTSGATTITGTFTAHALADTISDPPFLTPVPNITAPNGTAKVTLSGTDLQLDLLRYGYQRVLPVEDQTITSSTSPVISIPLISNTDNTEVALLDHWNPSTRGFDKRIFHIGAGAKPIRGSLVPIPAGYSSSLAVSSTVANFNTADLKDTAASFTASVNYGDGTYLSGTSGVSIVKVAGAAGVNSFRLKAVTPHTYTMPGEYPVIVKISDNGGAYLTLTATANVSDSYLSISGTDITATKGAFKNEVLATFEDKGFSSIAVDYSATVDWGDGSVTPGTIKVKNAGESLYQVLGNHAYLAPGTYTVSANVTRTGTNGHSAYEWSTANVSGVTAPQLFPPFPQAHLAQMWSTVLTDSNTIILSNTNNGSNPYSGLVTGADGNFYGTTNKGGANGSGTVFQITPAGDLTTLYSFSALVNGTNADGANPVGALLAGTDGDLYGTTFDGGSDGEGNGDGTVFRITPQGAFTTLHVFTGLADGANPYAQLTQGTDGNIYGTTTSGGLTDHGLIFQLTYGGTVNSFYQFTAQSDGAAPFGGVVTGSDGNLYGTTTAGGGTSANDGTVYEISYSGTLNALYSFTGGDDGSVPYATLLAGTDGNLYGTTTAGGANNVGTVFDFSPTTSPTTVNTLHAFTGSNDGMSYYSSLITGTDGNLYGTAITGGTTASPGTVYQMSYGGATFNTLYAFSGGNDGGAPYGALITGSGGYLYGTTETDGSNGAGTVYQLSYSGSLNTLFSFAASNVTTFQDALRCSVVIINSGNKPSTSGTFSVYIDPSGELDGNQTAFTSNGQDSFLIPPLLPGKYVTYTFYLQGSVVDSRLKLPLGIDPSGQEVIGVVDYHDPVGDFDGSQKIISPYTFP